MSENRIKGNMNNFFRFVFFLGENSLNYYEHFGVGEEDFSNSNISVKHWSIF